MLLKRTLLSCILILSFTTWCYGQDEKTSAVVTYDGVVDNPYEINKLWIHIQPLYAELFVTNVNFGFGVQVDYQIASKLGLSAQWRRAYAQPTDFAREVAQKNQDNLDNNKTFNYFQLGGTIHLSDQAQEGKSKIVLYSKRYRGKRWANRLPEKLVVPSQVRKVYGLRWGGFMYNSTTDANKAAMEQSVTLVDMDSNPVGDASLYTNVQVKALYVGASLTLIKNVAIKPHRDFGVLVNDLNFNAYIDVIYAPSVEVDDIMLGTNLIAGDQLATKDLGFRLGIEGKFNKKFGYAYGAELGYRPSIENRTFYALFKMSFPVFGVTPHDQPRPYRN